LQRSGALEAGACAPRRAAAFGLTHPLAERSGSRNGQGKATFGQVTCRITNIR
jgi:hypothetical protein